MRYKDNVTVTFTVSNKIIVRAWEKTCLDILGTGYEPEITSGLEGDHALESGHYHGRALDFEIADISSEFHMNLRKRAQDILGPDYYVILETNPPHMHIQRNKNTF